MFPLSYKRILRDIVKIYIPAFKEIIYGPSTAATDLDCPRVVNLEIFRTRCKILLLSTKAFSLIIALV